MAKIKPTKSKKERLWAEAKRRCRLNREDIRMAMEMGLNPRLLIKNIPSPSQQWKAPVKIWIRELYQEKTAKRRAKKALDNSDNGAQNDLTDGSKTIPGINCLQIENIPIGVTDENPMAAWLEYSEELCGDDMSPLPIQKDL